MSKKPNLIIHKPDDIELPDDVKEEEFTESYTVVKRLLPFLAKRGIPATPKNYRIFYDYLLYANPALNKTINELLDNNAKFYSQLSCNLYDYFYSNEALEMQAKVINQAAMDFMAVSSSMEQSLENAMNQTSRYKKVLNDSSKQMAGITSPDELQSFLEDLMNETDQALTQNDTFSSRINEANHVIANLKEELKNQTTLAKVDELTKLYNRRHLNLEAPRMISHSLETGLPLSAIMFDLDHFKKVNDTWGHTYGDKVLVICADTIKKSARGSDLPVRYGGEEFLLLCSGLDLMAAARVAERIRLAIANTDITVRGNSLPVTISAGVAQYIGGEELNELIGRADKALYQAKGDGRNRVRLAQAQVPEVKIAPGC
jgi:diguanylate cyclase